MFKVEEFDFGGWATRNNRRCSDGRTILRDAFKHNDGEKVPLVWNHQHNDPLNVLGHAILENREDGVYAYCTFNDTESGRNAKKLVEHGDISSLSIFANQLKEEASNVMHGVIREVSLVIAGANPGAYIDAILEHSDSDGYEAIIYTGEGITLSHADNEDDSKEAEKSNEDKTVGDVLDTLNKEQKQVVFGLLKETLEDGVNKEVNEEKNEESEGGDKTMKHNLFDHDGMNNSNTLSHADVSAIFADAKRCGSLKAAVIAHADKVTEKMLAHSDTETQYADNTQTYGINGTDFLFPDARTLNTPPEFIKREMGWVQKVMNGVHHTPFSRIKSMFADITEDDARAKGYIKGNLKKEEVFGLLKRTTTPTTVYKKQKIDRDDWNDITDFDVVAWLKSEMRMMLDEELARAILVGDGRLNSSDDKINELNIRPIWKDEDLFTIKATINVSASATDSDKAKSFIKSVIKSRKNYKGSGEPTLYTTEDVLTDCLLIEDATGRIIYDSIEKLKSILRVKDIITVPVMEGLTRTDDAGTDLALMGLIVNLKDYNVGADKGGAVNMFDDFDIDYNQQKYLIETRCSGALIKPFSAIAIELKTA